MHGKEVRATIGKILIFIDPKFAVAPVAAVSTAEKTKRYRWYVVYYADIQLLMKLIFREELNMYYFDLWA